MSKNFGQSFALKVGGRLIHGSQKVFAIQRAMLSRLTCCQWD